MKEQSILRNRILSRLSSDDFARLGNHLEMIECPRGMVIGVANEPLEFVYFLERGVASIVAVSPQGQKAEAGIIGREGFVHPAVALGADRIPHDIEIQLQGDAHRMLRLNFVEAVDGSDTLRRTALLFAQANAVQIGFTTLSNAVHQVDERLARWLLMCHDRSESDDIPLTHQYMGLMLSVRRPSVTNALHLWKATASSSLRAGS